MSNSLSSPSDSDQTSYQTSLDLSAVNPDILEAIFLRFSKKDLMKCAESILDSKEDYEGENYIRSLAGSGKPILANNFSCLSIKKPFERGLRVHENPNGLNEVTKHVDPRWVFENGDGTCSKYFDITIKELGLSLEIMDNYRPPIVFSEWVVNRSDCGCLYRSSIQLFNENRQRIAWERQEISFNKWQHQLWQKFEVAMQSYPPGARSIRVLSSGRDLEYWQGHYGPKMAGSQLIIKMDETPLPAQFLVLGDGQNEPME
uniref:FBA domain-containing protein n=1 Tax=Panagrolaimus sp. PS1159 TaxID=55785 RepID=A0AC35EZK7_9BILA